MAKNGICVNVGNCDNANQKKVLEIGTGQDFSCPQCGKSLIVYAPPKGKSLALVAGIGALLLVLLVVAWRMSAGDKESAPAAAPAALPPAAQPVPVPAAQALAPVAPPAVVPAPPESTAQRLPPCGTNDDERRRLKLCD